MFDWGDGEFSEWAGPFNSGETGSASHNWTILGDYNVRVIAKDMWGAVSGWSDVTVFPIVENTPPDIPTITGPSSGRTGVPLEFKIVTTDPDEQDVYYNILWGNAGGPNYGPFPSGEEQIIEHTWTIRGDFTIKVKAKDTSDAWSETGELQMSISKNRAVENLPLVRLLQRFPNLFPIIRYLLGL